MNSGILKVNYINQTPCHEHVTFVWINTDL